jgi:hypothetical protein
MIYLSSFGIIKVLRGWSIASPRSDNLSHIQFLVATQKVFVDIVAKHVNQPRNPHLYTEIAKEIVMKRNRVLLSFFKELKRELELGDLQSRKSG